MKRFLIAGLMLASVVGCQTVPTVVTPEPGPTAAELEKQYQQQITDLKAELAAKNKQLDSVAGNSVAISAGLEKTPDSLGKPVITKENELIHRTTGEPSPESKADALARANALLRQDIELAKKLYGEASTKIDELNGKIVDLEATVKTRDGDIVELQGKAKTERDEAAKKLTDTISWYEERITTMNDEASKKERRMWVNTLRFGGFAVVLAGIAVLAITKGMALLQGLILIGSGALVIGIGMAFDIVAKQTWFPYAAGVIGLAIVGGGSWFIFNLYQKNQLHNKLVGVLNDVKTEAATLKEAVTPGAENLWAGVEKHIEYRLGEAGSSARKQLDKLQVKLGLDSDKK